jgi:hypothetical protein
MGMNIKTLYFRRGTEFSALKVRRQCPLVLLVEVRLRGIMHAEVKKLKG